MKILGITALACGVLSIQGCSVFTNPMENPVIEDKSGHIGTLATTAQRRVVIINRDTNEFCAEPPADAADNLTSSFASALEGSDGTVTAKAEMAKTFASTAKQLFKRSQGVQLYRDGMYSLCQAFINKAISPGQFQTMQAALLKDSSDLIGKELQYLQYLTTDNVQPPATPIPPKLGKAADEVHPAKPSNADVEVVK